MRLYRIEMPGFVAGAVTLDNGRVAHTAPILSRFLNQPFCNLRRWVAKNGGSVEFLREVWP